MITLTFSTSPRQLYGLQCHLHRVYDSRVLQLLWLRHDPERVLDAELAEVGDQASFRRRVAGDNDEGCLHDYVHGDAGCLGVDVLGCGLGCAGCVSACFSRKGLGSGKVVNKTLTKDEIRSWHLPIAYRYWMVHVMHGIHRISEATGSHNKSK